MSLTRCRVSPRGMQKGRPFGRPSHSSDRSPGLLGAASRFAIGLVIVSGMSIGTLFTLFVLPAVYTVLAKDHRAAAHAGEEALAPAE